MEPSSDIVSSSQYFCDDHLPPPPLATIIKISPLKTVLLLGGLSILLYRALTLVNLSKIYISTAIMEAGTAQELGYNSRHPHL